MANVKMREEQREEYEKLGRRHKTHSTQEWEIIKVDCRRVQMTENRHQKPAYYMGALLHTHKGTTARTEILRRRILVYVDNKMEAAWHCVWGQLGQTNSLPCSVSVEWPHSAANNNAFTRILIQVLCRTVNVAGCLWFPPMQLNYYDMGMTCPVQFCLVWVNPWACISILYSVGFPKSEKG